MELSFVELYIGYSFATDIINFSECDFHLENI